MTHATTSVTGTPPPVPRQNVDEVPTWQKVGIVALSVIGAAAAFYLFPVVTAIVVTATVGIALSYCCCFSSSSNDYSEPVVPIRPSRVTYTPPMTGRIPVWGAHVPVGRGHERGGPPPVVIPPRGPHVPVGRGHTPGPFTGGAFDYLAGDRSAPRPPMAPTGPRGHVPVGEGTR